MTVQLVRRRVGRLLAVTFFILPFVTIGGKSVFRFDVPTLRLHILGGELWMEEFTLVLLMIMSLVSLFLLVTFVFGRVWCGWACPQTVFTDLTGFMDRLAEKSLPAKILSHLLLLLLSLLVSFIAVCYVVSPYEAIPDLLTGNLGPVARGSSIVLGLLIYADFAIVRQRFCATICPYGKIQGALVDEKSLLIQLDPGREDECIDCKMCVHTCPTKLDIRKGMQVGCIMCARCVDACGRVMQKQQKKGLVNYSFGVQDVASKSELLRPVSIALALVCVFTISFVMYKIMARSSFEFSILPHRMEPHIMKGGDVMNAYILSIKNKRQQELVLTLDLQPENATAVVFNHNIHEQLLIPAGLVDRYPLFVRAKEKPEMDLILNISLSTEEEIVETREKSVYFNIP